MIITERPPRACPKCSPDHKPVCGTDGNTYRSKCYLDTSNCNKVTDIVEVAHEGECLTVIPEPMPIPIAEDSEEDMYRETLELS